MSSMYDIIFAGGGTTACVIAGRLVAANPSLKILIVESGQHSRDIPSHIQPCKFIDHFAPNSTTVYFHAGKPSTHLNGRAPVLVSGKGVGGGSVVNSDVVSHVVSHAVMCYTRGAASDYDDWGAFGNKGWCFNELLPLIKKLEMFTPISDQPTHGYSGPVQIAPGGAGLGLGNEILSMARAYDPDRPQVDDANDFKTPNAYSPSFRYVDPMTGKRCDAASRYLYPQSANPNLDIIVGKCVKRVIIENGRAVGIEYTTDGIIGSGELVIAKASKLVVVSAGAFGSPAILERSGIGGAPILEKNNIPVLVDLPGVGENYQDHLCAGLAFYTSDETRIMKGVWTDPDAYKAQLKEWEECGTGEVAHNGIEAIVRVRPTAAELASVGCAFQQRWKRFFEPRPDKSMSLIIPFAGHPFAPDQTLVTVFYFVLYPDSTGSVHITPGEDANSPLNFDPNLCSKDCDLEQLTFMYKMTRELYRRIPAYRGEAVAHHPKFPLGSAAACKKTSGPVPIHAPNIVYSAADDEAIANFHRETLMTGSHSLGTCAMKPREQDGVVDERLNVYGVEGLKVADLSICPSNVGNNTYSTALLIGEKAAVIIAEDLGLSIQEN